jgi:hypothetical protein
MCAAHSRTSKPCELSLLCCFPDCLRFKYRRVRRVSVHVQCTIPRPRPPCRRVAHCRRAWIVARDMQRVAALACNPTPALVMCLGKRRCKRRTKCNAVCPRVPLRAWPSRRCRSKIQQTSTNHSFHRRPVFTPRTPCKKSIASGENEISQVGCKAICFVNT